MKHKILILILFTCIVFAGYGQLAILHEGFDSGTVKGVKGQAQFLMVFYRA